MQTIKTRSPVLGKGVGGGLPLRYVAGETLASVAVNATVAALPILCSPVPSPPSVHSFATSLTPQIIAGATMSVLAPSLLTCWRHRRARTGWAKQTVQPTLGQIASTTLALAATFAATVLVFVHLALPTIVGEQISRLIQIEVSATQGILAAALLTPLALHLLFKGGDR